MRNSDVLIGREGTCTANHGQAPLDCTTSPSPHDESQSPLASRPRSPMAQRLGIDEIALIMDMLAIPVSCDLHYRKHRIQFQLPQRLGKASVQALISLAGVSKQLRSMALDRLVRHIDSAAQNQSRKLSSSETFILNQMSRSPHLLQAISVDDALDFAVRRNAGLLEALGSCQEVNALSFSQMRLPKVLEWVAALPSPSSLTTLMLEQVPITLSHIEDLLAGIAQLTHLGLMAAASRDIDDGVWDSDSSDSESSSPVVTKRAQFKLTRLELGVHGGSTHIKWLLGNSQGTLESLEFWDSSNVSSMVTQELEAALVMCGNSIKSLGISIRAPEFVTSYMGGTDEVRTVTRLTDLCHNLQTFIVRLDYGASRLSKDKFLIYRRTIASVMRHVFISHGQSLKRLHVMAYRCTGSSVSLLDGVAKLLHEYGFSHTSLQEIAFQKEDPRFAFSLGSGFDYSSILPKFEDELVSACGERGISVAWLDRIW